MGRGVFVAAAVPLAVVVVRPLLGVDWRALVTGESARTASGLLCAAVGVLGM
jgi:hypothetical protein